MNKNYWLHFKYGKLAFAFFLMVISAVAVYADFYIQNTLKQNMRVNAAHELGLLEARLEDHLHSNIQLVKGLSYTIKTEPDLNQERFSELAQHLFFEESLLKMVAAAPNLVNKMVYPVEEYKAVIGMDYTKEPKYIAAALEAKKERDVILAGPMELMIGGGTGVIARFPIFIEEQKTNSFWGIMSAVIDADKLFQKVGLNDPNLPIDITILGKDAKGHSGELFFGASQLLAENPVSIRVNLPTGSWQMYAIPKGGWIVPSHIVWSERATILFLALMIIIPVTIISVMASRQKRMLNMLVSRKKDLQAAHKKVAHMASHDALTGLPNRHALTSFLKNHKDITQDNCSGAVILAIDLDNFKQVNDKLGHAAGDQLLQHVSQKLKRHTRETDLIVRLGGDEFMILYPEGFDERQLSEIGNRILNDLAIPFVYRKNVCETGASIGIARAGEQNMPFETLHKNADLALYEAKRTGKNNYEFYTRSMGQEKQLLKSIEADIRRGLANNEFIPYYQMQFDASNFDLVGMEALARWNHPIHGVLSPARFLDAANEFGLTSKLDGQILKAAVHDIRRWQTNGTQFERISVNLSTKSLESESLINWIEEADIPAGTLSIEILETVFLDDDDGVLMDNINRIKACGIGIEIDDFGTGNASFIALLRTHPERLKIDQRFVRPEEDEEACEQIVKSIVEVAKSMQISVVAEGVETSDQTNLMKELGCDVLQGYAFAKPLAFHDIEDLNGFQRKTAV